MTATELYKAGKLSEAIQAISAEVREHPTDVRRRTFLFELLCFAGDFGRAEKHLNVLAEGGPDAATGVPVDVLEVVKELTANYGVPVQSRISGNYRLGDIRHNFADMSKITKALGFTAKTSFKEGIKQFTDWVSQQQLGASKYEESITEMREKGLLK